MSEIDKFEGDMFWDADDPEQPIYEPEELMGEVGCDTIVEFQQAKSLPSFFGVEYWDEEKQEYVDKFFTTREEAEACNEAHKVRG